MPRRRSRGYLHRSGQAAAENEIEPIPKGMAGHCGLPVEKRDQAIARALVRDTVKNGISRQQRISGKIHLRDQAREQPRAEKRKVNVRRAPGILMVLPRVGAGFYGDKTIAAFTIGEHASAAGEIRVERRAMLIHTMAVAPRRVGLPNFDKSSRNAAPFFIQYAPAHDDAFADGFTAVLPRQVIVVLADVAMAESGAGELGQSVRQQNQRLLGGTLTG